MTTAFPSRRRRPDRLRRAMLAALACLTTVAPFCRGASTPLPPETRREMVSRGLDFLFSIQKDGAVGDSRRKAVTSLFVLACLSSGVLPDHPEHGERLLAAWEWIAENSSEEFLGDGEEPNAGHAMATLALTQLVGMAPDREANRVLLERSVRAVEASLELQDKGVGGGYFGGWRRNAETRVNDRVLTAWFLQMLHGAELLGVEPPRGAVGRAVEFMVASQKKEATASGEDGGFSLDPQGLPVRSATGAGLAALALHGGEADRISAARDWLGRNPPRWYGPNFYESNFFVVRGLWRSRRDDGGETFERYFGRLSNMLRERQESDGRFPFPPGHGGPVLAMGPGFSTAMAVLILNVDRGLLPADQ